MARKQVSENKVVVSTPAAAAPARRKTAAPKRVTRTSVPAVEVPNTVIAEPVAAVSVAAAPSFEAIASLAYSYWVARGGQGGSSEQDWLRAEQELSGK